MSSTGLDIFDKTLQTTNIWLDEIMQDEAIGPDRQVAWRVLGATLRAIRDRLPVDLAAHLGAQLPLLVRGAYYDQFRPADLPGRERSLDAFLERIGGDLAQGRPVNVRDGTRAALRVLTRHIDPGQLAKVLDTLPEAVRGFWRQDPEVAVPRGRTG
jgi:uncharacterized protein (DUF2267 family)